MTSENDRSNGMRGVTRRTVIGTGAGVTAASVLPLRLDAQSEEPAATFPVENGPTSRVSFRVNGQAVDMDVDTRASLLDLLRERIGLTGTKKGCDHGQCGACTVHLDGRPVSSCLTLAAKVDGREVTTIEGLAPEGEVHPMQQAFIDHDALQCGYCTPGQIMSAVACVQQGRAGDAASIREFMSGNLCRCGAYVGIVAAVQAARSTMEG
ncbi:MAG: (2Fe-2S)-binding protein [Roseovarius sp.]